MPSKTMFLFLLAAFIAIFLPPFLISSKHLEVIGALVQARDIAVTALVDAPPRLSPFLSHAVIMVDTLFALYAQLCGVLSSGPLVESRYRTHSCYERIYRGNDILYPVGNAHFAMYQGFCNGVERGLRLPGFVDRVPLPRTPVLLALLGVVGMALLPALHITAIRGSRLVVRFARRLTAFGQSFLACAVSIVVSTPIVVNETFRQIALPIPAAVNIISVIVAGLTSIALVILTIVTCWGSQMFDAAYAWWTGGRKFSDVAGVDKGTQTPRNLSGVCKERALDCKDMVRRYIAADNALDNERHQHRDDIARRDKVLRDRDAEIHRLHRALAARDKKLVAVKEELAASKMESAKSSQDARKASNEQSLERKLTSLKQEAKFAELEGDNMRLGEQLIAANQKIEALEKDLSNEKHARAQEQKGTLEAAQAAVGLSQSKEAEAAQKVERLGQELSALKDSLANEQQARLEVTQSAEAHIRALEAEATQRIGALEQSLAAQQQEHAAQLQWKDLEATQAKGRQAELDKVAEHKLESIQRQLTAERKAGAEREVKHYNALKDAEAKFERLVETRRPKKQISDWPVEDLLEEVVHLVNEENPFADNVTTYYWAQELKGKLNKKLPSEDVPDSTKEAEPSEETQASAASLAARHIKPCKGPSAKLAAGGGRKAEQK
ncbi:hypothetical protein UCRPA7_724 [Phaeoacremonium minimum UCRPA7]|uniref:Uncharacterized protein n=1 Tax=Phaeoacremonium minimum (strain UCR-PA7) TaxID=1286976 RepID=R8BWJ4_PHAM7|nr:hypothetical protein UCRPA7_724 [Phaeoacremonium minimum UCRPA7]EOO03705.1 hypothetical protein UCRPA7_724 [Phaeoacremonium minimum UCRPA7]